MYDGAQRREAGSGDSGAEAASAGAAALVRITCIVIGQGLLQMAQVWVNGLMKKEVEFGLRERVLKCMLSQDTAFFDSHHTAALEEYLINDAQEVCNTIQVSVEESVLRYAAVTGAECIALSGP